MQMIPRILPATNTTSAEEHQSKKMHNSKEKTDKNMQSPERNKNHILSQWGYSPDRKKKTREKRTMRVSPKRPQHPTYDYVLATNEKDEGVVNPYQMLQVRVDATRFEIKQAYRRLALWHHPGRNQSTTSQSERERRAKIFAVLAACCETLLERDSRARLDALLKRPSSKQNPSDTEATTNATTPTTAPSSNSTIDALPHWPGQKQSRRTAFRDAITSPEMPILCASSSDLSSQSGDGDEGWMICACGHETPKASANKTIGRRVRQSIMAWSAEVDDDMTLHSGTDTNRLFAGPLSLMYQARLFRTFTDPNFVFERYFGSSVFTSTQSNTKNSSSNTPQTPSSKPTEASRSSSWTGSVETLPDGTTIYTTERILNGRKIIKKETISVDPRTGKRKSEISVKGEDLVPPIEETEAHGKESLNADCNVGYWTCCNPSLLFSSFREDCKLLARAPLQT